MSYQVLAPSPAEAALLWRSLPFPRAGLETVQIVVPLAGVAARRLCAAWTAVARRHERLRCAVGDDPGRGGFAWLLYKVPQLRFQEIECDTSHGRNLEEHVAAFVPEDRARGFALGEPLWRITLLRAGASAVMIWTLHHALADGRAFVVALGDLLAELQGRAAAAMQEPGAATLTSAPSPAAVREAKRFFAPVISRAWAAAAARPALAQIAAGRYTELAVELDSAESARLLAHCRRHELSRSVAVQVAWGGAVAEALQRKEAILGAVRTLRDPAVPALRRAFALLVNTQPVAVEADVPLGEQLRRTQQSWQAARRLLGVPLAELARERPVSGAPAELFDALVMLDRRDLGHALAAADPWWAGRGVSLHRKPSSGLTLFAYAEPRFELRVGYYEPLFSSRGVARMLAHMREKLAAIAVAPSRRRSARHPPAGEGRLTYPAPAAHSRSVPAAFDEVAATCSTATALAADDRRVSYGELQALSRRIAAGLHRLHIGTEEVVAVSVPRSMETVAALLAILRLGAAYMPLDPSLPPRRRAELLAASGAVCEIGVEGGEPGALRRVALASLMQAAPGIELPPTRVEPANACYVMYTSGSTGSPKGVVVEHRSVVSLVRSQTYFRFAGDEVFLQAAPLAFDASTFEIWGPLLNGGTLAIPPAGMLGVHELCDLLDRHRVTSLWLTAGLFAAVVESALERLGGLRQLITGGDVVPPGTVERLLARFPRLAVTNGYGPTECTTFACAYRVPPGAAAARVPIGRAIARAHLLVVDRDGRPSARGELLIGGTGVARGYLGDPALTAERFVPDPTGHEPGGRVYQSGDDVELRADGELEFLGRLDRQVKLRGFRIEPEEIEAVLAAIPAVASAAVVARRSGSTVTSLVGFVVPRARGGITAAEVTSLAQEALPSYMVPAQLVVLDAMPIGRTGKIDRSALAALLDEAMSSAGGSEPATVEETALQGLWSEVLGVTRVPRDADFFELGGDSMAAMRIVARIDALFGVKLGLAAFFEQRTVADLAASVRKARGPQPEREAG